MALFLAHPAPRALTYRHEWRRIRPGYLRVLMLAEMLRRMGFERSGGADGARVAAPL